MKLASFQKRIFAEPNSGCWLWLGGLHMTGYGIVHKSKTNTRQTLAHRFSYEMANGPISPEICVLHKCDTRPCVNPNHLFLGDRVDNAKDRDEKGRNINRVRQEHGSSKLADADVLEIRNAALPRGALKQFWESKGISKATYYSIRSGRTWKHLGTT